MNTASNIAPENALKSNEPESLTILSGLNQLRLGLTEPSGALFVYTLKRATTLKMISTTTSMLSMTNWKMAETSMPR